MNCDRRSRYASKSAIGRVATGDAVFSPRLAGFVLDAFARGADGVLIGGCHPGDCHYVEGNYKALRRIRLLERLLGDMGIEPERFRLDWISASEGEKVRAVVNDIVAKVAALGPLDLPGKFREWDHEMDELEQAVNTPGEALHA